MARQGRVIFSHGLGAPVDSLARVEPVETSTRLEWAANEGWFFACILIQRNLRLHRRVHKRNGEYCLLQRSSSTANVLCHVGTRAIDRRNTLGKALDQWREQLVSDLGGAMTSKLHAGTFIAVIWIPQADHLISRRIADS